MSEESGGEKVPLWYVSFADMITLLLAFFVMLQAMASTKEPTLFCTSLQSFRRAISRMGLPDWLFERDQPPNFNYKQLKYPDDPTYDMTPPLNRSRDPKDDKIRDAFDKMQKSLNVQSQNVPERKLNSYPQIINFTSPNQIPDDTSKATLTSLAHDLRLTNRKEKVEIKIIGLAQDQGSEKEKLTVSAMRAIQAERIFLDAMDLRRTSKVSINAWGAGDGKSLVKKFGQISPKVTIIVVVLGG